MVIHMYSQNITLFIIFIYAYTIFLSAVKILYKSCSSYVYKNDKKNLKITITQLILSYYTSYNASLCYSNSY